MGIPRSSHAASRICGARSKQTGMPCRRRAMRGRRRCSNHGGIYRVTPRRHETRPAHRALMRKLELFRQLGIPWYGGRPRKPETVRSMVDDARDAIARDVAMLEEATSLMPDGSAGKRLGIVALKGLDKLEAIVDMELDRDDPKQMRLIGDMALGCCKLFQRAAEGAFKAQQGHTLVALLEALKKAQEGKG